MGKAGRLLYEGFLIAWDGFWVVWISDLLWLLFCLPILTAPLGFAGLYECAHGLAYGDSLSWRTFFSGVRRHLGACYRWAVFNLGVVFILAFYVWFFSPLRGSVTGMAASLVGVVPLTLLVLWWIFNLYTFPFMLAQEEASYLKALRNSLVMLLKWPGVTLGFTLFNIALIVLSLWLRFPLLVFGGSLPALMACLCVKYSIDQTPIPGTAD